MFALIQKHFEGTLIGTLMNEATVGKQRSSSGTPSTTPLPNIATDQNHVADANSFEARRSLMCTRRRVTGAFTANEVHEYALDPELVPKPLILKRKMRNAPGPAPLQLSVSPIQSHRLGAHRLSKRSHFSERSESQQLAHLDIATRQIASGYDAAEVAILMDLDLTELIQYIACFTVEIRETASLTEKDVLAFNSTVPKHLVEEKVDENNKFSGKEGAQLGVADGWHEGYEEEETFIVHQSKLTAASIWDEIQTIFGGENGFEEPPQEPGGQIVVETTAENQDDSSIPYASSAGSQNYHQSAYLPNMADLEEAQHGDSPPILTSQPQENTGDTDTSPPVHLTPSSKTTHAISRFPSPVSMILAVFIGRALGVLLSELHESLFETDDILSKILFLYVIWPEAIAMLYLPNR